MEMRWDRHLTGQRDPVPGEESCKGRRHFKWLSCTKGLSASQAPSQEPLCWAQQVKSSPDNPPTPPDDRFSKLFLSSEPFEVLAALELVNQPLPKLCTLLIALSILEAQSLGTRTEWPLRTVSPCTIGSTFRFVGYRKLL